MPEHLKAASSNSVLNSELMKSFNYSTMPVHHQSHQHNHHQQQQQQQQAPLVVYQQHRLGTSPTQGLSPVNQHFHAQPAALAAVSLLNATAKFGGLYQPQQTHHQPQHHQLHMQHNFHPAPPHQAPSIYDAMKFATANNSAVAASFLSSAKAAASSRDLKRNQIHFKPY
jgi:hypothetical protein